MRQKPRSYRICVAEDDVMYRKALEHFFHDFQELQVSWSKYGEECLAKLSKEVDIIVLDYVTPGISGEEVLQKIRDEAPQISIIVVSGAKDPSVLNSISRFGPTAFVPKDKDFRLRLDQAVEKAKWEVDQLRRRKSNNDH